MLNSGRSDERIKGGLENGKPADGGSKVIEITS